MDDRQQWAAALAEHDRQFARFDELPDDFTDDDMNAVSADYTPARYELIGTPAPDLAAVLRKFEIMWNAADGFRACPDSDDLELFHADLRQLAGAS